MKLSSQRDLLIVVILTFLCLLSAFILTIIKYPFIIVPFISLVFLTGYSIVAALHPGQLNLKKYSISALVLGFSLFVLFVVVLMSFYTPFNLSNEILFMVISIITILMVVIAFLRRTIPSKKADSKPKKAKEPEVDTNAY